eukprot:c20523_g1_i1.p1 GENE.c20523_g1_i1~~c20523_g1_i1.p1  ORF type:complete len:715 (+),score=131.96 c20523_g1_i1:38-2146(+)
MASDGGALQATHMRKSKDQIKNRTAAQVQITAEQILVEAQGRVDPAMPRSKEVITDKEELDEYRLGKRREFEAMILRQRSKVGMYVRYAQWEASQSDFRRARSVFERALDVDPRNVGVWVNYSDMEMKNGFIASARNILDRAVTLLPRIDQFWIKFVHMEELLGNVPGARTVYQRWMQWMPDKAAWAAYINFERRYEESDRARAVCEDMIACHPDATSWLKYAAFEQEQGAADRARSVYERGLATLGDANLSEKFFLAFAEFEERAAEPDRARVIYKYGVDLLPRGKAERLHRKYLAFEKQNGSRAGIETAVLDKRRAAYEEQLAAAPDSYDVWFDYIRLEEEGGDIARIRELYERAVAAVPPETTKLAWDRYIYLWIFYAVFEELTAKDAGRTRQVYTAALALVPHAAFTFPDLWILAAEFELRQANLSAARRVLGNAIGHAPQIEALFARYIDLEFELLNFDRCRTLLAKLVESQPDAVAAWLRFARFEISLGESERARSLFELAVELPSLDTPELLWKAYIDYEIAEEDTPRATALFERLLNRTQHVKVWLSYASTLAAVGDIAAARGVYARADAHAKNEGAKDDRVAVLEAWLAAEEAAGESEGAAAVKAKLPQRVKRRRKVVGDDGAELGWEEYFDYLFPDLETKASNLKFLEAARLWAAKKAAEGAGADGAAGGAEAMDTGRRGQEGEGSGDDSDA